MKEVLCGAIIGAIVGGLFAVTGLSSSKGEQMNAAIIGAVVGGLFAIVGTFLGLYFGPPLQIKSMKAAKVRDLKIVYRELVRSEMKQLYVDYKAVLGQLNIIGQGGIRGFTLAEETHPLIAIIEADLSCLKPKEMLTVSMAIDKENLMTTRRRNLNTWIGEIRSKKKEDPNAIITNDLAEMRIGFLDFLASKIELNVMMYQALVSLGVDDYVYVDGKKKTHQAALEFWKMQREERKPPYDAGELRPFEPHGHWEEEQERAEEEVPKEVDKKGG